MLFLNLGCGTKTSDRPGVVNIDRSPYLRIKRNRLLAPLASKLLSGERLERFRSLPDNIRVHDLSKGIPFADVTVDVIYHSHFIEHIDREAAEGFLREALRALKPGGIHRIAVPDFEAGCRDYLSHLEACGADPAKAAEHDEYIAGLIEQSVRREASGASEQSGLRRLVENILVGDARKRGETHQWAYDRVSLTAKLVAAGYREVHEQSFDTSLIPDWQAYGLDSNPDGTVYKPGTMYLEAVK